MYTLEKKEIIKNSSNLGLEYIYSGIWHQEVWGFIISLPNLIFA